MSNEFLDRIGKLSPKRLALLALELHEQVDAAGTHAPVAVVGIGCRFPGGADDPATFWQLLREGRDVIREVPAERWDVDAWFDADVDAPAKMSVRHGGFLDRVDGFDAAFFGISPREALTLDPQQRLALEVAWEALEHAGIAPESLAGSATGVFLGICNSDHFQRVLDRGDDRIDAYLASGNAHSVASGRIAYFLGLQGPALSVDTACSSSLVALHLACRSVRSGESRIALAGGVNVMCSPQTTVALTKAHMLAPDGRCKTFAAAADGFSRAEGCGFLVLKRLDHARADGDRVLAVIRGSAVNQDGRSGGLTVPNGPAQEAVIRAALADAQLAPADIDYVEAHGTGTTLGDPIEVRALAGAFGPGRAPEAPLVIGSVKTNLGHLESAAGVAGVIKAVLALQHEHMPPHLHFTAPSPHIPWADYPVRVEPAGRAWPRGAVPRRAGVSSFGFSGTNGHVIIEEAPIAETPAATERPLQCLPLSARTPQALRLLAQDMADALDHGELTLADAAHTLGVGRSHFAERLAVVADTPAAARDALRAFADGRAHDALHAGTASPGEVPEVVFMFTGQGAQYPGMAERLMALSPVFRGVIDACDAALGADAAGRRLKDVLRAGPAKGAAVHETAWTQPALFAVEFGLTQLWRSWGVTPAAVIGHSVGEYIGACVAGVFSLEDGLRLIAERGRLMQALPPGGAMAAVFAPADEVARALAPYADQLAIAALNAPDSVVVSGDAAALDTVLADLATRNVEGQRLFVSLAAHSPLVAPALDAMQACAARVAMSVPAIPVAWNLTGGALPGDVPDAVYWRRHLREPVRFGEGLAWLRSEGYRHFLEVGPHPTLTALAQRSVPEADSHFATSLRRGKDDWQELMHSLAALYVRGAAIDWAGVGDGQAARRVTLPTYPFERRSFWVAATPPGRARIAAPPPDAHPLLGTRLDTARPTFELLLTPERPAYLGEHRVHGVPLAAGPVFLEMAQVSAAAAFGAGASVIADFVVHAPLLLPDAGRVVQLSLRDDGAGVHDFEVHSRGTEHGARWQRHATGRLLLGISAPAGEADSTPLHEVMATLGPAAACESYYQRLDALGISLGPRFRSLDVAHRRGNDVLARVVLPAGTAADAVAWAHPGLLDGALQTIGLALPEGGTAADVYLLTGIEALHLAGPLPATLWCQARLREAGVPHPAEWRADVVLRDDQGAVLGRMDGVLLRRAARDSLRRAVGATGHECSYRVAWEAAPLPAAPQLVPPAATIAEVRAQFTNLAHEHALAVYDDLLPELDRLSGEHVAVALRELGFDDTPGRWFSVEAEATALGVVPGHRRLFARLLQMLAEDGVLRVQGVGYECAARLGTPASMARYDALLQRFAGVDGELSMLRRCGGALSRILRGMQDPLQLLFPGGTFAEARKLYVESPYARTYNAALATALTAAIAAVPASRRLRVLEIGAGTGGTTSYVLPLLPADRVDYTFTDLSPLFLERAGEQFGAYTFLRRALLDIERDPAAQGFAAGQFDVVIAANVLHATSDLRQALLHARELLAPEGQLFMLEGMAPERWVDLSFGLTDGWWRFADTTLRADYPLIGRQAWKHLLGAVGFADVAVVPEDGEGGRAQAQQALLVARARRRPRTWNFVGGPAALAGALEQRLHERGDLVRRTTLPDADVAVPAADEWVWLDSLALGDVDPDDAAAAAVCGRRAVAEPLQGLAALQRATATAGRAWLVTQGAHAVAGAAADAGRWQAPLWGVGRVFALEQPDRWGGLVDLSPQADVATLADELIAAIDAADGEDQVALRQGRRLACRLVETTLPPAASLRLRDDATYLVTGGFGGLGLVLAQWLAARGARHIALLGRRPEMAVATVRELEALGVQVIGLQGDVADGPGMQALLLEVSRQAPPVRGVFHLAAAISAARIGDLDANTVTDMLRPKIDGTLVLERLAESNAMDFLVLFSSTTALLGAAGMAHYAAANAFLDATAERARAHGRPLLSINWGTWDTMRLASTQDQAGFLQAGLEPMDRAEALDALARLLSAGAANAVVARADWPRLKTVHEARRQRPFLRHLGRLPESAVSLKTVVSASGSAASSGPTLSRLAQQVAAAPSGLRRDVIVDFVQHQVANVLALQPGDSLPLTTGLFDLGMDSLMAVDLKRRLEQGVGESLPSSLTFNYPNIAALASFLESRLSEEPSGTLAPKETGPEGTAALDELTIDELEQRLAERLGQVL